MSVKNLRDIIVQEIDKNKAQLRELQYQNYVVHMYFYNNLIKEHVLDLMTQAVLGVTKHAGLSTKEKSTLNGAVQRYTNGQLSIGNIGHIHEKVGYKVFKGPSPAQANAFDKLVSYRTPGIKGTPKMQKGKVGPKVVFVHARGSKHFGVHLGIAQNNPCTVATYKASMGSDEANRAVMRTIIQNIIDNSTYHMEQKFPYLKGGARGRGGLTNKTRLGNDGQDGNPFVQPGPFSARGNYARLHGPVAGRFNSGTLDPTVNDEYGDTSVAVVGLVETLRGEKEKAHLAGDFVTSSATMYLASKLDASFSVNSTTISDLLKFDKVIEFAMALGSNTPGSTPGSQQAMMSKSDTDAVLDIVEKIVNDVLANPKFNKDFKTSKGITQRMGEIGGSAYLKEILSKKWWNKPNMRLRVNKQLVKLGKSEKEMSEALHSVIVAGATKLQGKRNPKKGRKGSSKVSNRQRIAASTSKQRQSPMALKNLINSVLPQAVAMKMNPPSLRYRTGRFANSARVTQVMQGPRGGLQADYTYMRDPYGTFEPGGKMGSVQRDPRRIIGQTIREIVAQAMQNKFIKVRRI
jgi:hypothetical protein